MAVFTGLTELPAVGELSYNGVVFSALYTSKVNGPPVPDDAGRTTKYMEWNLEVEGTVTLNQGDSTTDATWAALRKQLSVPGGPLVYRGQGFGGLIVNAPGSEIRDVKWGPVPKVIYFQPLGQGRSALIRWQVTTCIPEITAQTTKVTLGGGGGAGGAISKGGTSFGNASRGGKFTSVRKLPGPVVQYNYEATVSYDEEGYSRLSLKGVLEIPMTRATVDTRTLPDIVDSFRATWLDIQINLAQFRVTSRSFNYSRDKRTINWEFSAEELAPMGLPAGCTIARGSMSVRPAQLGGVTGGPVSVLIGCRWNVTLRASYVVRKDDPQRVAAEAFYFLLWFRMKNSAFAVPPPPLNNPANAAQQAEPPPNLIQDLSRSAIKSAVLAPLIIYNGLVNAVAPKVEAAAPATKTHVAYLSSFGFDEGLYMDSKSMSFEASWWIATTFSSLMAATGVWQQTPDTNGRTWATSVADIMGYRSWLMNSLDATADVIVDMGGGTPTLVPPFE